MKVWLTLPLAMLLVTCRYPLGGPAMAADRTVTLGPVAAIPDDLLIAAITAAVCWWCWKSPWRKR